MCGDRSTSKHYIYTFPGRIEEGGREGGRAGGRDADPCNPYPAAAPRKSRQTEQVDARMGFRKTEREKGIGEEGNEKEKHHLIISRTCLVERNSSSSRRRSSSSRAAVTQQLAAVASTKE